MKKIMAILLAMTLMFSCAAMAAGLSFTTGGQSGTYFAYGNVLAQYISNNTDVEVTAVAGNGSADNIDRLELGEHQLAFVQNDVAGYAAEGVRLYEGTPVDCFTALAALYTEQVQLVTDDPEIKSVADLKGKKVSIGAQGSGVYFNALDFLTVYDMTLEDIDPQYLAFQESADALQDGKIDAFFCVSGAPTTAVTNLCTVKGAYLVSITEEDIAKLQQIFPGYASAIIPAGTYQGIDTDTATVGIKATIIANGDVTDDQAYTIVSTIFENKEAITQAHAKGAELDLEYAAAAGMPYHAGAAKYFAEKGITVQVAE